MPKYRIEIHEIWVRTIDVDTDDQEFDDANDVYDYYYNDEESGTEYSFDFSHVNEVNFEDL